MGAVRLGPGSRGGRVLVALALARDYLGVDSNKTSSSRTRKINRAEPEEPTHDWESVSWRHEWIQFPGMSWGPCVRRMGDLLYHAMNQGPDDHESRLLYGTSLVSVARD